MDVPLGSKPIISIVSLILLSLVHAFVTTENLFGVHLQEFDDILHETSVMDSLHPVSSLTTCAVKCANKIECKSFFFVQTEEEKLCQTHSLLFTNLEGAEIAPGTRYYQLEDWCPQHRGYTLNRKHSLCYRYISTEQDWTVASDLCEAEGGHLLWLTSQAVADHIKQFLSSSPERSRSNVAVGIHMTNGLDWTLTNGTKVTFTDWGEGEPNNLEEDCVIMAWYYNFCWNDGMCSGYPYSSMCQIDKNN